MEDKIVYITIDNWNDYSKLVGDFVEKLDNEEFDVNCNIITYDQCLFFFVTTTMSWIKEHHLENLKKNFSKSYLFAAPSDENGKTKYHPKYDTSIIGTDKNYDIVAFL